MYQLQEQNNKMDNCLKAQRNFLLTNTNEASANLGSNAASSREPHWHHGPVIASDCSLNQNNDKQVETTRTEWQSGICLQTDIKQFQCHRWNSESPRPRPTLLSEHNFEAHNSLPKLHLPGDPLVSVVGCKRLQDSRVRGGRGYVQWPGKLNALAGQPWMPALYDSHARSHTNLTSNL
jgi:hypothetical protein